MDWSTNSQGKVMLRGDNATTPGLLLLEGKVWERFLEQVRAGAYDLPGDPEHDGETHAGWRPEQAEVGADQRDTAAPTIPAPAQLWYGDPEKDPNAYIAITFEPGAVLIRDGSDPTGAPVQISNEQWRSFIRQAQEDQDYGKDGHQRQPKSRR